MKHEFIGKIRSDIKKQFLEDVATDDIRVAWDGLKSHILKRNHHDILPHLTDLKEILDSPDYVGVNPRESGQSLEYIKRYDENVLVAIKLHKTKEYFYVPTMYRLQEYKLQSRIKSGRLKKIDK